MKPNVTATELAPLVVGFSFLDKLVELRSHERLSIWLIRILKCFLRFLKRIRPKRIIFLWRQGARNASAFNEYIEVAGLQSGQPLFQSVNSLGTAVTGRALNRYNAWAAIRMRVKARVF
jgi:hypothetical protein